MTNLFPSVKVMKDKKSLRSCRRLEEIKEKSHLNAVWDPGLDPGTEKES